MTRMLSTLNFALLGLIGSLSLPALAADDAPAAGGEAASSSTPAPNENDRPPLLFGKGVEVGGYGGLDAAYTRMFGRDGLVVGGQGAVLINHRLALGLAGYGWSNPLAGPNAADGDAQRFETGYGGFTAHYSFYFDALPVYFTVGTLVGAGAINLTDVSHSEGNDASDDVFAILQPDIAVHANLTRWMRVGLTGSYRVTSGVNQLGFKESDVNGAMVGAQLQFGSF